MALLSSISCFPVQLIPLSHKQKPLKPLTSLPEFLDFKFFGKTILVVRDNYNVWTVVGQSTQEVSHRIFNFFHLLKKIVYFPLLV